MLYLIGLNHLIQYTDIYSDNNRREKIQEFAQFLRQVAHKYNIELFVEEFSEEALAESNATTCTIRDVAHSLNIEHRFCDPDTYERQIYGISGTDFNKRIRFWLARISDSFDRNILLACGDGHIDDLKTQLENKGFMPKILGRGWGNDIPYNIEEEIKKRYASFFSTPPNNEQG